MKARWFLMISLVALVTACGTTQTGNMPMGNPAQMVSQLEADLAQAKADQVDVLAPGYYDDAQKAFIKAKQNLEKGAKLSRIGSYVSQGTDSLNKAMEIAQVSRTILAQTNQAREKALKVGADQLGKPYLDVEKQYLKLTQAIERDNLSYAQDNAPKVQKAFRDVEIMAIKNSALKDSRQMIADAEAAKIHKIAPSAYGDASRALDEADAYIEQDPYASETIARKAGHAEFMSKRMMAIQASSNQFQELTPEESALYLESQIGHLGKTLQTGDIRNRGVDDQLRTVNQAIGSMQQKNQSLEGEIMEYQRRIADLEQQLVGLQGYARQQEVAKQRLSAEREFNERFTKVQQYFRPDEAEVYKQKGQLVVRLKGIQFPVGKATLTPDNYGLLSKVQQAIQTFGKPFVTVEGHTDSTGSAKTNLELSQQRADAVKAYLVANNTLPASRIQATGYGPDRPLAPNTTAEGRAVNRRIDLLISPSKTQ